MQEPVFKFVDDLVGRGIHAGDPEELRSHKKIFAVGLTASCLVSLLWGLSYTVLGLDRAAWVGYGAVLANVALLTLFRSGGAYRPLLLVHSVLNLLLPFVAQCLLGGIQRSGCLGLWAVVGPLTVLVHELPGAWIWFTGFLMLQLGSVASEAWWAARAAPLAPGLSTLFLISNLVGVLSLLFFPLQYVDLLRRRLKERVRNQAQSLAMEHANSERLLHNMLPEAVARRLKAGQGMVVQAHGDASVLFADIAGFTGYSAQLPPAELVEMLNSVFCLFDALAEEFGLEKIKTIGDAYMAVGNVTGGSDAHLADMAEMALAMQQVFASHGAYSHGLNLRLGIHCGPVVAGVIGTKKLSFDLWGDTVNVASRLESQGEPGRVQVSQAVQERLRRDFLFEERGPIELKGRGVMHTWWLLGRRPAPADGRGLLGGARPAPQFI